MAWQGAPAKQLPSRPKTCMHVDVNPGHVNFVDPVTVTVTGALTSPLQVARFANGTTIP